MTELDAGRARYVVMRADDNGNEVEVIRTMTRREAEAVQRAYEARAHKQIYWVVALSG